MSQIRSIEENHYDRGFEELDDDNDEDQPQRKTGGMDGGSMNDSFLGCEQRLVMLICSCIVLFMMIAISIFSGLYYICGKTILCIIGIVIYFYYECTHPVVYLLMAIFWCIHAMFDISLFFWVSGEARYFWSIMVYNLICFPPEVILVIIFIRAFMA